MPSDPLFHMVVADVFTIAGRGTVVTGTIDKGTLRTGDAILIRTPRGDKQTVATGIEKFRKVLDQAAAGDNVGVLLGGVAKQDVQKGDELFSPDGALSS